MSQAQQHKETRQQVARAVRAVESKKGEDVTILEMDRSSGPFTDYCIVCSGSNPRQIQAIADEVERQLAERGLRPNNIEGYNNAEWVLLDYVDFVVNIFSEGKRKLYDLERLWKSARRLKPEELGKAKVRQEKKVAARKATIAKVSGRRKKGSLQKRKGSRKKATQSKPGKRR